jgi:hypothetical protein
MKVSRSAQSKRRNRVASIPVDPFVAWITAFDDWSGLEYKLGQLRATQEVFELYWPKRLDRQKWYFGHPARERGL